MSKSEHQLPGVGQYNPERTKQKEAPALSFGKAPIKTSMVDYSKLCLPPPTAYTVA